VLATIDPGLGKAQARVAIRSRMASGTRSSSTRSAAFKIRWATACSRINSALWRPRSCRPAKPIDLCWGAEELADAGDIARHAASTTMDSR